MNPPQIPTVPRATYRLQFNATFGFDAATRIVPYLEALGISHVYASPLTMARPGSAHGYDAVDFSRLNPELGDEAAFERLIATLHCHGMGLILDFVPNHMGVGADNPWWMDVLEWGQESPFAAFFDIDWARTGGLGGKVLLPVLGGHYGRVLEAGELQLKFDAKVGGFQIAYFDRRFPIAQRHYPTLLRRAADRLDGDDAPLAALADRAACLNPGEGAQVKSELATLACDAAVRAAIEAAAAELDGIVGEPESFESLHRLLEEQAYRLAYWRVASAEINYRRFFDIDDLAGVRVERPEVFESTHALLLRLIAEGKIQGVRLDHIDGLLDPRSYCERLLAGVADVLTCTDVEPRAGRPIYLVVEKILAGHEHLRDDLPVAGTTGYEFMNLVGGLFVDPAAEGALTATYQCFTGEEHDFDQIVRVAKRRILSHSLASELGALVYALHRLAQLSRATRDHTLSGLRDALVEVIVQFAVYRTYVTGTGVTSDDRRTLDAATSLARATSSLEDPSAFEFLQAALSTDLGEDPSYRREDVTAVAMRFQQLTGPVMAKSVEDTAFYRFLRLVSLNEVGGEPSRFGVDPSDFHEAAQEQLRRTPLSMLATATHDHKRGEDVRARLNALSELPSAWDEAVRRWSGLNRQVGRDGERALSPNDEYLLYQTLIGAWPLAIDTADHPDLGAFAERIVAYMIKACREAKLHTSWTRPDDDYEAGVERFVRHILDPGASRAFLEDLLPFQTRIARIGAINGLAQTLLKLTAPGVPDTYQGTELWDLSLVDPDNRRRVDFELRQVCLDQASDPTNLLASWRDGRIKQHVVTRTLALRRQHPTLFTTGSYLPLRAVGSCAGRVFGFTRRIEGAVVIVIVPRLVAKLLPATGPPHPRPTSWGDTRIELPPACCYHSLSNRLTDKLLQPTSGWIQLSEVLADLPVAALVGVV